MSTNRATAARTPAEMMTEAIEGMVAEHVERATREHEVMAMARTPAPADTTYRLLEENFRRELSAHSYPFEARTMLVGMLRRAWTSNVR